LQNISLSINENEKIAFVGGNGAGKSTLLLHLNGILMGDGDLKIIGLELIKKNLKEIRKNTGLLFEDPDDQLFCPTVFEDIAFGPLNLELKEDEIKKRVTDSLSKVGLDGFENRSPHHLSYGEKKRIALATLFAMNPKILALDEPTSNLDPKSRRKLIEILKSFNGTVILATHDLECVLELCNRAIVLKDGQILKDGDSRTILSDEKLMIESDLEVPLSLKQIRRD
jgi:cobalt/nickel transport system ATP-binding protein